MKRFAVTNAISVNAWNSKLRDFEIQAIDFDAALEKAGMTLATGVVFTLDSCGPYEITRGRAWPLKEPSKAGERYRAYEAY